MLKNFLASLVLLPLTVASVVAQQPPVSRPTLLAIYPAGGKAGETFELKITENSELEETAGLIFSHPGISAKPVMTTPDRFYPESRPVPNTFQVTIAPNTPPGIYEVRATVGSVISNARRFAVGDLPETRETEDNNSRDKANEVQIGSTINGLFATDYDYFRFTAKQGQRAIIDCRSQRLDSRGDPVLLLLDANGRELARNHDTAGLDSVIDFQAPAAGDYYLRVNDLTFAVSGGAGSSPYRITLADRPWIDFVEPPIGERGTTSPFTLYGSNLGGNPSDIILDGRRLETISVSIPVPSNPVSSTDLDVVQSPWEAAVDSFCYRYQTVGGWSNPVSIALADGPLTREAEPNDELSDPQPIQWPAEIAGKFDRGGDVDGYVFDAKKGDALWIEIDSARLGQPTDPVLVVQRLNKRDDGTVSVQDVNVTDDVNVPNMNFRLPLLPTDPSWLLQMPDDGRYRVLVRDQFDTAASGRPTYYRLKIRPPRGDFHLVAVPDLELNPDNNNNQALQPRAAVVRRGGSDEITVFAYRQEGYNGEIELRVEGLPGGVQAEPAIIGPDMNWTAVVIRAEQNAGAWRGPIRIVGRANIDNRGEVSHPAQAIEMLWQSLNNDPTASRLAPAIMLAVDDKLQFPARVEPTLQSLRMARGGKLAIPLKLAKQTDWNGNVNVAVVGLPPRINKNTAGVDASGNEGKIELDIQQDATPGRYTIFLRGDAEIDYRRQPELEERATQDRDRINQVKQQIEQDYQKSVQDRQTAEREQQKASGAQNNANNERNQAAQSAQQAKQQADQTAQQSEPAQRALDEATKRKQEADSKLNAAADENAKRDAQAAFEQSNRQLQQAQSQFDKVARQAKDAAERAQQAADKLAEAEKKLEAVIAANKQAELAKQQAQEHENQSRADRDQGEQKRQQAERDLQQAQNIARQRKAGVPVHSRLLTLEIVAYPVDVRLNTDRYRVTAGGEVDLVATANREFDCQDEITCFIQPPNGIGGWSLSPDAKVPANQNEGRFELRIDRNAKPGDYTAELLVRMRFNNRQLDQRLPIQVTVLPPEN